MPGEEGELSAVRFCLFKRKAGSLESAQKGRKTERILRTGIRIDYRGIPTNMGHPPQCQGCSVAPSRAVRAFRSTAAPHFMGANPRRPASGYRPNPRVRSKARSATAGGSKRIAQNLHFLVWRQGGSESRVGSTSAGFRASRWRQRGKPRPERCRPIALTIRKSCPGLRRMISRTTAPSGASPRPRAPRGGRHACKSTRRPRPRFSRAKAGVGERFDSTP